MLKKDKRQSLNMLKESLLKEYGFFYSKKLQGIKEYYETAFKNEVDVEKRMDEIEKEIELLNKELNKISNNKIEK